MKLSSQFSEVQVSNMAVGSTYTVEDSAMASHVLSSNIYSYDRRCEAVLREFSTNAQDSMQEAGKGSEPISVHLPTLEEPYLIIRDHGIGLTPDDAKMLFSIYFKSLSSEREHANGVFGVGSKSAFAYTSMFTIEAIKDGVRSIHQSYKDEEDRPRITRLSESETDEPNGVSVTIPVETKDIKQFITDAIKLYQHFKAIPVFVGHDVSSEIKALRDRCRALVLHEGEGWSFYKTPYLAKKPDSNESYAYGDFRQSFNHSLGNSVVIGSVSYPLDFQKLCDSPWSTLGNIDVQNLRGLVLHLNVATDPLNLDTGREKLQYTQRTCEVLSAKVRSAIDFAKQYFNSVSKDLSDWSIRCLYNQNHGDDMLLRLAIEKNKAEELSFDNFTEMCPAKATIKMLSLDSKDRLKTATFSSNLKKNSFSEITPYNFIQVYVKSDRRITRDLIASYLFDNKRTKKYILVIEKQGSGLLKPSEATDVLRWLGHPETINDEGLLNDAERVKEEHRESLRRKAMSPKLEKIRVLKSNHWHYTSAGHCNAEKIYSLIDSCEKQGKKLRYYPLAKKEYEMPKGDAFLAVSAKLIELDTHGFYDVLLIPADIVDILSDYKCLVDIKKELRALAGNPTCAEFKLMVKASFKNMLGDNSFDLQKMQPHVDQPLINVMRDLCDHPRWKLKVFDTISALKTSVKKDRAAIEWVEVFQKFPYIREATSRRMKNLAGRYQRARSIYDQYPLLTMIDTTALQEKHANHQKLMHSLTQYILMTNNSLHANVTPIHKLKVV